jgi:Ca2+-binding RTX toxin-like protein
MGHASVAMTNEPVWITRLRGNRDANLIGTNGDDTLYGTNENRTIVGLTATMRLWASAGPTSTTSILLSDRGHS